MKIKYIIPALLIIAGLSIAFTVTPSNFTINYGNNSRHEITVNNDENTSINVDVSTNCQSYIMLSSNSLTIPARSSSSLYFVVSPFPKTNASCSIDVGSKRVDVSIYGSTSSSNPVSYKYDKYKWVLPSEKVSISVEGQEYDMLINDISDTIDFDVYMGNTKIDTESLGQNDTTDSIDSVLIKVVKLYPTSHRAKLEFMSKDTNDIQITMSSLGTLVAVPKAQSFILSSLDPRQFTIKFKNMYDIPVSIDDIRLDQITDGFRLDYTSQDSLDSGEELPVVLTITPADLSIGQHVIHVCMDATYRDRSVSACSEIDVTIPNTAIVNYATENIQIDIPQFVVAGQQFTINVTGVNRPTDLSISSNKNDLILDTKSVSAGHGIWRGEVTIVKPGTHTLTFLYKGNQFSTKTINVISAKDVDIVLTPKNPKVGDNVGVSAKYNDIPLRLDTTVNGNKTSNFTVEAGTTYKICVSTSFDSKCINKTFQPPYLTVTLPKISPDMVISPNLISVENEKGDAINNFVLYVDDVKTISQVKLSPGTHTIRIESKGYETYSQTIQVPKPPGLLDGIANALGMDPDKFNQIVTIIAVLVIFGILVYWYRNKKVISGRIPPSDSLGVGFSKPSSTINPGGGVSE